MKMGCPCLVCMCVCCCLDIWWMIDRDYNSMVCRDVRYDGGLQVVVASYCSRRLNSQIFKVKIHKKLTI